MLAQFPSFVEHYTITLRGFCRIIIKDLPKWDVSTIHLPYVKFRHLHAADNLSRAILLIQKNVK